MPAVTTEEANQPQPAQTEPAETASQSALSQRQQWMQLAGIPEQEWLIVEQLVMKESSWNPKAVNPSSGACGLAQALPCSKISGNWSDPVVALRWQKDYVARRYGSYAQAWEFWQKNNWY